MKKIKMLSEEKIKKIIQRAATKNGIAITKEEIKVVEQVLGIVLPENFKEITKFYPIIPRWIKSQLWYKKRLSKSDRLKQLWGNDDRENANSILKFISEDNDENSMLQKTIIWREKYKLSRHYLVLADILFAKHIILLNTHTTEVINCPYFEYIGNSDNFDPSNSAKWRFASFTDFLIGRNFSDSALWERVNSIRGDNA